MANKIQKYAQLSDDILLEYVVNKSATILKSSDNPLYTDEYHQALIHKSGLRYQSTYGDIYQLQHYYGTDNNESSIVGPGKVYTNTGISTYATDTLVFHFSSGFVPRQPFMVRLSVPRKDGRILELGNFIFTPSTLSSTLLADVRGFFINDRLYDRSLSLEIPSLV